MERRREYCSAAEMYKGNALCKVGKGEVRGDRDESDASRRVAFVADS